MPKAKNPHVFMDISIGGGSTERITFELFANVVPKTVENFRALCTGERGLGASTQKPLYYKGTNIHRIVKGFVAQGGDFSKGDGRGGESIYGGKFPDENFRLTHDQPGMLSMANAGPDTNGSQFFITFKPLPHLDGKHVVFGKVASGIALLKKLEAVGGENGNPSRQVKIVDCGEVSNINTQDQLQGEKDKKLRKADGNSIAEGRAKSKKASSDDKHRKKRKHYSSDSYSSDTSDSRSYSSDSGSESESYSSSSLDTSSSSDHRRKRRKGSKKDKRKPTKRKSKHTKSKKKSRGSKRRSRRSYGSSSDDSIGSSSSDSESGGHRTKRSSRKADKESTKTTISEEGRTFEDVDKGKQMVTAVHQSHDGSKPSRKDENGADDRSGNYNSEDRNDPVASSRINPIQADTADGNGGADTAEAGVSRSGTERHPPSNEPVATNGKDLAVGSADNGQPQRIRKGRGFTEKYGYARRYRTPSPERPPVRPRYDGGRDDRWNSFNRYGRNGPYSRRSPVRRYHGSPRASSPSRYPRRDRSRSRSRSPARRRDRGGYRRPSPRRSHSPAEQTRRDASNRPPRSGHGGGPDYRGSSPLVNRGRSRSRSKSRDPSRSKSPEAAPAKRESSRYNRRRSSSSRSSSPDGNGNKGLVSY
ncbi:peptidyl-prolyl cis-trans isomerase CYP63 isoform X1 [Setaria italica]|uniref:peptidyl-prolyl cis-trans isomerase CYP63 isoform X1 n=1 Tax=Setaria italica TaxID=4555 RepID=UPI000351181E|nr:peptidyl-prolyl cis-trans isomerase CYP63 isoform X1 [Setaria italica]XP_004955638.1 peptidyl-prolyl cis-trans isomerase CYP63 isoform X1 [Setaria italica]XP_022680123.1 peptidyl-prolyl cis-trans isomerase CYP63 isoform X1 [Setaria italica]